jgi:hypothetical protein
MENISSPLVDDCMPGVGATLIAYDDVGVPG